MAVQLCVYMWFDLQPFNQKIISKVQIKCLLFIASDINVIQLLILNGGENMIEKYLRLYV